MRQAPHPPLIGGGTGAQPPHPFGPKRSVHPRLLGSEPAGVKLGSFDVA
jgi:hypothetical protein